MVGKFLDVLLCPLAQKGLNKEKCFKRRTLSSVFPKQFSPNRLFLLVCIEEAIVFAWPSATALPTKEVKQQNCVLLPLVLVREEVAMTDAVAVQVKAAKDLGSYPRKSWENLRARVSLLDI